MSNLGTSFGQAAGDYDRGRPGYVADAVAWAVPAAASTVVDVGAGTGKLTQSLVAPGREVIAVDPDQAMLDVLTAALPDVTTHVGTAERLPLADASADAIVLGQAWHWVEVDAASAEAARVLRPGGVLGLLYNIRDERVPWVRELTRVMKGSKAERLIAEGGPRVAAPFEGFEEKTWEWAREMSEDDIVAMVHSRSYYIAADAPRRHEIDVALGELLATVPRSEGGTITLPYVTHAYRAKAMAAN